MNPGSIDTDNELVAQVLAGKSTDAFGELVRRHQSQVRTFLLRLCRNAALADDLSQDCFIHAWDKLSGYRGDGSFIGWLMRIAWTTFLQSKRKTDRYREVVDSVAQQAADQQLTMPAHEVSDLDRFLAVLSEEERGIMILSYACGLSHREISETTALPVGTVKSIIHRSKEKIRNDFEIPNHQHG